MSHRPAPRNRHQRSPNASDDADSDDDLGSPGSFQVAEARCVSSLSELGQKFARIKLGDYPLVREEWMQQISANWSPSFISGLGMEALRLVRIKTAPKRSAPKDIVIGARPGGQKPSLVTLMSRDSDWSRICCVHSSRTRG